MDEIFENVGPQSPLEFAFTFADGVLAYDCAACEGKCCKHGDLYIRTEQLVVLRRHAPALVPFLRDNLGGEQREAASRYPRCWFLGERGACTIEVDLGRAAKPASCVVYPLSSFVVHNVLFVDLQLSCPLGIAEREGRCGTILQHAASEHTIRTLSPPSLLTGVAPPYALAARDLQTALASLQQPRAALEPWSHWLARVGPWPLEASAIDAHLAALHDVFTPTVSVSAELSDAIDIVLTPLTSTLFFKLVQPYMEGIATAEALASVYAECAGSLIGLRYLAECGAALNPALIGTGQLQSILANDGRQLELLGRLMQTMELRSGELDFEYTDADADITARFVAQLGERRSASLFEHLTAFASDPIERADLFRLIMHNRACFEFHSEGA